MSGGSQAVKPDTESKAGILLRVDTADRKHIQCTIPAPSISIQPEPLHTRHLAPHSPQLTSTSTLGSVNGKRGSEPHLCLGSVHLMCKLLQHSLEVAHGDALVDHQAPQPDGKQANGWRPPRRRDIPARDIILIGG